MLFFITIVIPIVGIVVKLPSYYLDLIKEQESSLLEGTLTALTFDIQTYLDDLERMTVTPYLNNEVMLALKLKSTSQWQLLTPYEQYEAEEVLNKTLPNYLKNMRKDILGTILLPMDGSVYITPPGSYSDQAVKGFPFAKQDWYIKAVRADGNVAFTGVHKQDYLNNADSEVFSVARLIKDPDSSRPLGIIMADADTDLLDQMMKGIRLSNDAKVVILDDNQQLIYANHAISTDMLQQLAFGSKTVTDAKESYSVVREQISRANWVIAILSPEAFIQAHLQRVYWIGFAFAASGLLIALILYFTVSHWIVTPFKRMIQVMKRVQRGDMDTRYRVKGNDEISQLGVNLNTMISKLGELIDREYKAVLGKRNAEYRALQSQIQPHFLYNTLNGFIGLNRTGQSMQLERAILSLSGMLRYTLEHNDWAQLQEEIDFINKYCGLQQVRFADKIQVHLSCDPDALTIMIPKLLLQPIIENAIIHGIEPCDHSCELHMEIRLQPMDGGEDEELSILIRDNGVGYDVSEVQEGLGIRNVRERLQLSFEGASMAVRSAKDEGTSVQILIPVKDVRRG
ncbi:sensor histidine kinase [Paenibacillus sp. GCM10023248]|uniref:cache domain-containing sensor histidine kinase n=1 Tax=Bacillales TaxID=1385 RepID=UPI002377DBED|nr:MULTISPECIES: sensor histidine kinase [Bacillales]MDD9267025.1 sensor histidine kinase [Paenibacillus sp. MAHUQ-63]MDR6881226.1 two-component system sensor histidine kinase YesM [Bacillus sp. 3255]